MKTILETIEEHLSKPWNRGSLMTISNRLNGSKAYCVEITSSKNSKGDRYFLKKEECKIAEQIIIKYNKVRQDARKEKALKIKIKALAKKEKMDALDPSIITEDIEDDEIEDPEDETPDFSEKMMKKIEKTEDE